MGRLLTFVFAIFSVIHYGLALTGQEVAAHFKQSLSPQSEVFLPTDPNYTEKTTQRWTIYEAPTYIVAVKPAFEVDIQKIIRYASANNIPILATGGAHGYSTTLSRLQNGISIDLSLFRDVFVDATANTMTIGGAVTFADIFDPLYSAGKEIQTGSSSSVGMVGATLGAGIGPLTGLHGLIIDALLSVRMVTGTSEIINASETENPHLFWGIRGAGFNFGIITSATYRIYDQTNDGQVMNADLLFPASKNGTIWEILKSFEGYQPDPLSLLVSVLYMEDYGGATLGVSAIYYGPREEGMAAIKPLLDAKPLTRNITQVPYNELVYVANFGGDKYARIKGTNQSLFGVNFYDLNVQTFTKVFGDLADFWDENPDLASGSRWTIEKFATRVTKSIPDDATAYPYRNATAYAIFDFTLPDNSSRSQVSSFAMQARQDLSMTSGAPDIEVYVHYAHGDEGQNAWYAPRKLPKLRALKKKWDPSSLFSFYNGLA